MSKNRNKPNAMARIQGWATMVSVGMNARLMKIPQTSSITIQPGSSVPVSFMAFFTNGMAAKKTNNAAARKVRLMKIPKFVPPM